MKLLLSFLICIIAIVLSYTHKNNLDHIKDLVSYIQQQVQVPLPSIVSKYFDEVHSTTTFDTPIVRPVDDMALPRAIRQVFLAIEQGEGAGARVRRSIGTAKLRNFSPFLMLDHFSIGRGAGFPDHPHRGQETITYLLSGGVDHEDFAGNKGTIGPGDLQFMTAGKGIMHAEMPHENEDGSPNVGKIGRAHV